MRAHIVPLFRSPLVRIYDFQCEEERFTRSPLEYSNACEMSFIRSGWFSVEREGKEHEVDMRFVLLNNKGSVQRVKHTDRKGDRCTIFQIDSSVLPQPICFHAPVIPVTPALDMLHALALRSSKEQTDRCVLRIETLMIEMLLQTGQLSIATLELPFGKHRNQHIESVERAKQYLLQHFDQDISLVDVARAAYLSEFHFARIFKHLTAQSPYRYLIDLRLQHAAFLMRNTSLPVTRICFDSGFGNLPHFISSFHKRFGKSPRDFRS